MKIKEVIVVEGKNDTNHLKQYFDVDTIETKGLGINKDTINLIRTINENRGVILLLDPDSPGERIRKKINDEIPSLKNAFVFKEEARTLKKVGIEHASKNSLEKALSSYITYNNKEEYLTYEEFVNFGLIGDKKSASKRDEIARRYSLGKCNAKTLYKRMKMIGLTKEKILNDEK